VDLLGIIDWRVEELKRLGAEIRYDTIADAELVLKLAPDIVVIATGGQPQLPALEAGSNLVSTTWDVIGGDVRPTGRVLLYDDDGTHSALTAAEMLAASGVELEVVTPERSFGVEVGAMNAVSYARAMNEANARISLHQRVRVVERDGDDLRVEIGSDHSQVRHERWFDHVIVDHGTSPLQDLYFDLRPGSSNRGAVDYDALIHGHAQTAIRNPAGSYQLFRIGDAVEGRDIHAAVFDGLRFAKDF